MVKQQKQGSSSLIPAQLMNPLLSQKVYGVFTLSHQNSNAFGSYCSCLSEIASKSLVRALLQHPAEHSSAVQGWERYPPGICSLSKEAVGFCQNKNLHISSQLSLKSGGWGTSEPHSQILGSQTLLTRLPQLEVSLCCYFCYVERCYPFLKDPLFGFLIHHLLHSPV